MIALVGNMNNNFFALTRYLRDRGLEAHLFLLNVEMEHFLPEADTYDLSHRAYTHSLSFGNAYWFLKEVKNIEQHYMWQIEALRSYRFIIACGNALAFLEYFNIKIDIFVPYGSDVYQSPFFIPSENPNHRAHLDYFSTLQAQAIKNAQIILTSTDFIAINCYSDSLKKLEVMQKVQAFEYIPLIYDAIYKPENIVHFFDKSYWSTDFKKIAEQSSLVLFSHVRHAFKNVDEQTQKGNDKLIRALAMVCNEFKSLNPQMIFFEYGVDVAFSKELIHKLGLEKNVIWMPKMNRKDIMTGIYYSDIVCESFSVGYCMGGVIAEALIAHKPLINYIHEQYANQTLYKNFNAKRADEIFIHIRDYVHKKYSYKSIAAKNYQWLKNLSDKVLDFLIELITQ